MMKCVLVLVLLQLCNSFSRDTNLNMEIIKSLKILGTKVHFKSPETALAPSLNITSNHSRCIGLFSAELRKLLDNVEVTDDKIIKPILEPLKENLELLRRDPVHDEGCKLVNERHVILNIWRYRTFFKNLNNHR